jgi:hypothetical protein
MLCIEERWAGIALQSVCTSPANKLHGTGFAEPTARFTIWTWQFIMLSVSAKSALFAFGQPEDALVSSQSLKCHRLQSAVVPGHPL